VIVAAVLMAIGGSLVVAAGRAGERGMLSPNAWVGIRTPATTASNEAWYAAHEAAGRWISIGGWIIAIGGIIVLLWRPDDADAARIALLAAGLGGAAALYGGFLGHQAAIAVTDSDEV
jgi:fermentation-respiration switch protein FrsA (DUF1100 family)